MMTNSPKPPTEWKTVSVTKGPSPVQQIIRKIKILSTDLPTKESTYAVLHQDNYENYGVDDGLVSITHLVHPTKAPHRDSTTSCKLNTNPDTTNETISTKIVVNKLTSEQNTQIAQNKVQALSLRTERMEQEQIVSAGTKLV